VTENPETGAAASGRQDAAAHPAAIAFISAIVLVLELALIRQVPAEVRVISYFTNLLLMASFFGLGLGCILQRKRSLAWLFPFGILVLFGFVAAGRGLVFYSEASEVHYWLQPDVGSRAPSLPLLPSAVFAFLATALPFLALGQALARIMDRHPRLVAYGWDVAGSLAGVLLFALASLLHMPPWIWPPIVLALWALVFLRSTAKRLLWMAPGFCFLFFAYSPQAWKWSPYYFVQYAEEEAGLRVWVNSGFHQFAIDFTSDKPEDRELYSAMMRKWSEPYRLFEELNGHPPRKVLILGAGTGNDVVVARAHQAEEIVAVEIDPVILSLGQTRNPSHPYDSPEVRVYVDDARHFLHSSDERFDLIVFGTLDSQTLLSGQANLRLENYVYTRESLADARQRLEDGGVLAVYYSVFKPWLFGRLYATVREAFGDQATILADPDHFLFNATVLGVKGVDSFHAGPDLPADFESAIPSTDDWPFIYLEKPTIAPVYLWLIGLLLALIGAALLLLRRIHPVTGLHVNFLFLGLGFTLLESSAIVRLALLFGSTWTINPIVFAAALSTIFLANRGVLAGKAPSLAVAWPGICAAVLVNYFLPISWLLELPTAARMLACGALVGAPIYFAAVCFSRLFQRQEVTGYPLGLNLVGAMAGGLIEYLSMLIGMRQVWLVALAIYALAWGSTVLVERRRIA
jgi:Spermine/spermidine synthase domain